MKNGMILFVSLFFSLKAIAIGPITFAEKHFYDQLAGINKISFEIYSKEIEELLKSKTVLELSKKIYAKVSIEGSKVEIKLEGAEGIPANLEKIIKNEYQLKANILTKMDLSLWTKKYKFLKNIDGWHVYQDETGINDITEKKVKLYKGKMVFYEKNATGSLRTNIFFKRYHWSKGKKVPYQINKVIYEGGQSIELKHLVKYKKIKEDNWVVDTLTTNASQRLTISTKKDVKRKISETFIFSNYTQQ